jgi:hypothetical protein
MPRRGRSDNPNLGVAGPSVRHQNKAADVRDPVDPSRIPFLPSIPSGPRRETGETCPRRAEIERRPTLPNGADQVPHERTSGTFFNRRSDLKVQDVWIPLTLGIDATVTSWT